MKLWLIMVYKRKVPEGQSIYAKHRRMMGFVVRMKSRQAALRHVRDCCDDLGIKLDKGKRSKCVELKVEGEEGTILANINNILECDLEFEE